MAKYRVWAESISYVYLDVEANSEDEALQIADDADGGEFTDSGQGAWEMGEAFEIEDDEEDDEDDEDEDDLLDGDLEDQFERLLEEGDRKDGGKDC